MLRNSSFTKLAARLALNHKYPEMFISILINDLKDYSNAIKFISKLPIQQVYFIKILKTFKTSSYLDNHGSILIEHAEAEMLELIKKIVFSGGISFLKIKSKKF